MRFTIFILAALLLFESCDLLSADWEIRRGIIAPTNEESRLFRVPDDIHAGEPVTITVLTSGNLCVRPALTHQVLEGMVLTVEPYDSVNVEGDILCPDAPCRCLHTVNVTFPQTGETTLRIVGLPGRTASALLTVEFPLTVE